MVSVHLYEICKINKSKETDVDEWLSETGKKRDWRVRTSGYRITSRGDDSVLEIGGGEGCTPL